MRKYKTETFTKTPNTRYTKKTKHKGGKTKEKRNYNTYNLIFITMINVNTYIYDKERFTKNIIIYFIFVDFFYN